MGRMTVREVANHFGTSKNTISYRIKKLSPDMIERVGNKMYILDAGIEELAKGFSIDETIEKREKSFDSNKSFDKSANDQPDLIKVLSDQIEDLKRDKEKLNDQIADLALSVHHLEELLRHEQMKTDSILKIEQKPRGLLSFFKRGKKPAVEA